MARVRPKVSGPPDPPAPLTPSTTAQYAKDLKRQAKRGYDLDKLRTALETLCSRRPLAPNLKDHPLKGEWKGWRYCHIEPDWVLIYRTTADELILGRTGTHADLFE